MFADETNLEETTSVDFFIYGGVVVHADAVASLCDAVRNIRDIHRFAPTDKLKFARGSKPAAMDTAVWNAAKGEILAVAAEHGVQFMTVVVHHRVASEEKLIDWQLSNTLHSYETFLRLEDDVGMFTMDRQPGKGEYAMLRERFQLGSTSPGGGRRSHPHIVALSATCDGASHMTSVADVALGTFGYCVNERRPEWRMPRELMPLVDPLFWRGPGTGTSAFSWGITLTPAYPQFYAVEYQALRKHLRDLGLDGEAA